MGEGNPNREDGEEGRAGRELHGLVEGVFDKGTTELLGVKDPERGWVASCVDTALKIHEGPWDTEKLLFVLAPNGDLVASSRADAILVDTDKRADIVDWKFYHEELEADERKWQMGTMLVAVLQEYPELLDANCTVYYPILGKTYTYGLTRAELSDGLEKTMEIHRAVNQPNPPLRPGPWCARCRLLARCPAGLGSVEKVLGGTNLAKLRGSGGRLPTVGVMEERFWDEVSCWSPARLRGAGELLPLLSPLQAAIRRALRRDLEKDPGSHPDFELKTKRGKAKGARAWLWGAVMQYMGGQEFEECSTVSVAKVRDKLTEKFRDLPKHEARAKAERILAPYVTREETVELRRRK